MYDLGEIDRCRSCSGILASDEPFGLPEACTCGTAKGRKARKLALQREAVAGGSGDPTDLEGMLSDPGVLW